MSMDRIINMILRTILRRVVNKGVDAGFRRAGKSGRTRRRDRSHRH